MNEWVTMCLGTRQIRVRPRGVEKLLNEGWTRLGANQDQGQAIEPSPQIVDAGVIKTRAPKKKATKAAETAPEAATEDLGNAIKGD